MFSFLLNFKDSACRQWDLSSLGEYNMQHHVLLEMNFYRSTDTLLEKMQECELYSGGEPGAPPVHGHSHGSVTADQPISKGFFSVFVDWLSDLGAKGEQDNRT